MSVKMKLSLHGADAVGSIYLFAICLNIPLTIGFHCINGILNDFILGIFIITLRDIGIKCVMTFCDICIISFRDMEYFSEYLMGYWDPPFRASQMTSINGRIGFYLKLRRKKCNVE